MVPNAEGCGLHEGVAPGCDVQRMQDGRSTGLSTLFNAHKQRICHVAAVALSSPAIFCG